MPPPQDFSCWTDSQYQSNNSWKRLLVKPFLLVKVNGRFNKNISLNFCQYSNKDLWQQSKPSVSKCFQGQGPVWTRLKFAFNISQLPVSENLLVLQATLSLLTPKNMLPPGLWFLNYLDWKLLLNEVVGMT